MAAQLPIPVFTSLDQAMPDLKTASAQLYVPFVHPPSVLRPHILLCRTRYVKLTEEFEKRFGHKPAYIARAPGRVK